MQVFSSCSELASHCGCFSCWGLWAVGHVGSVVVVLGLNYPEDTKLMLLNCGTSISFGKLCFRCIHLQVFSNFSMISSLKHCFLKNVLFNFHILGNFSNFLLLLISYFILLWSENILCMNSSLLNLLVLILCPNMWSHLEDASCTIEENVHCCWVVFYRSLLGVVGL